MLDRVDLSRWLLYLFDALGAGDFSAVNDRIAVTPAGEVIAAF